MKHLVRAGECFASLAARFGVTKDELTSLGDNQRLASNGRNGHILRPGDSIEVPDERRTTAPFSSGGTQRYRVVIPTTELRMQLRDAGGGAVANKRYELLTPGRTRAGQTDGEGWLTEAVPATEVRAVLRVFIRDGDENPYETDVAIGAVDPDDDEAGVIHRLANLGYGGAERGRAALASAVRAFQRDEGLAATGEVDPGTRDRLRERHGS